MKKRETSKVNTGREFERAARDFIELCSRSPALLNLKPRTVESLRRDAARIAKLYPGTPFAMQANAILGDLAAMQEAEEDIRAFGDFQDELQEIASRAATAGFRYGALLRKIGWPKGQGKTEWPEWEFVRKAYKKALRKARKPHRPDVIDEALQAFQTATGKPSRRDWRAFIPHFKEQVVDKISR